MTSFVLFALYLTLGAALLVLWPLLLHPTLPLKRKIILMVLGFLIVVPGGLALYAWLGVPQLSGT